MDQQLVMDVCREAILLMITLSSPVMFVGLIVGVIIALLQALTQIQEMTLAFVPKIIAIFFMIYLFLPIMMFEMQEFMNNISDQIIGAGP
jgi:flagellar biosynthetic protein FliQ